MTTTSRTASSTGAPASATWTGRVGWGGNGTARVRGRRESSRGCRRSGPCPAEYCNCYTAAMEVSGLPDLERVARQTDDAVRAARARLVGAVRAAHNSGMTQTETARRTGRSQPEISRLLRFRGTTPLARRLRDHRDEVIAQVAAAGGSRVRVFGSVSTGGEHEGSDIDLLIRAAPGTGLLEISRLELRLAELLGTGVDVVPDDSIRPSMRRRVLSEAALL